jgi:hypothetical protein
MSLWHINRACLNCVEFVLMLGGIVKWTPPPEKTGSGKFGDPVRAQTSNCTEVVLLVLDGNRLDRLTAQASGGEQVLAVVRGCLSLRIADLL